jgi:hypothetical protein
MDSITQKEIFLYIKNLGRKENFLLDKQFYSGKYLTSCAHDKNRKVCRACPLSAHFPYFAEKKNGS